VLCNNRIVIDAIPFAFHQNFD